MIEVRKSVVKHHNKTQHKNYLLYHHEDIDRTFMFSDKYYYYPIEITKREWEDLEYVIELEEQISNRNYSKMEKQVKKS